MPYATTTRSTLRTRITERLLSTFWSTSEINAYINEALRVWNVLTGYNREVYSAVSVPTNQAVYTMAELTGSSNPLFILRIEANASNTTISGINLAELGHLTPTWFTTAAASTQEFWSQVGQNNVVLYPKPSGTPALNTYAVDLAEIPTADGDYIQVSEEDMTAIVDYAVFIARLKESGSEFQESSKLLQSFLQAAARYNAQILQTALYRKVMGLPNQQRQRPDNLAHYPPR